MLFFVHFFAIEAETGGAELHDLSLRRFRPGFKDVPKPSSTLQRQSI
jgi:hypothetical protein